MLSGLIEYNHLANLRVIDVFTGAGKTIPEAERIFSHILNAQIIWINRINQVSADLDPFQLQPVEKYGSLQQASTKGMKAIVEAKDLSADVVYQNSKGESFSNQISDILFHLINHSTYHRGQVASIFRRHDIAPAVTDYIFYKREGKL